MLKCKLKRNLTFFAHFYGLLIYSSLCAKPRIGEQNLHNEIDFPLIEMQISLPPTVSLYSSALRGLWLNYDHFSDYCPSFKLKKPRPDYISNLY